MSRDSVLLISVCTPTTLTPPRPHAGLGSPASLPQLFGKGIEENESDRKMTEREREEKREGCKKGDREGRKWNREGRKKRGGWRDGVREGGMGGGKEREV